MYDGGGVAGTLLEGKLGDEGKRQARYTGPHRPWQWEFRQRSKCNRKGLQSFNLWECDEVYILKSTLAAAWRMPGRIRWEIRRQIRYYGEQHHDGSSDVKDRWIDSRYYL